VTLGNLFTLNQDSFFINNLLIGEQCYKIVKGRKVMDKNPLIGVSICAVVLLVLGSFTNVVGIESSQGCGCGDPPCWPVLSGTMGDNNWYVSSVSVWFNGSYNGISYRIDGGSWQTYTEEFSLTVDGIHLLEWTCDYNMSNIYSVKIKIDRTIPLIALNYTWDGNRWRGYDIIYTATANDEMSGMNRVEFYIDDELHEIINGSGPDYVSTYPFYYEGIYNVRGFILNPKITDDYVKFYSILVTISVLCKDMNVPQCAYAYDNAGNWDFATIVPPPLPATIVPGPYLFKGVILPNNYTGRIGMFFIKATFYDNWGKINEKEMFGGWNHSFVRWNLYHSIYCTRY